MSNLFGELKRRNVFKVAVAYVIVGWVVLQVAETIAPIMSLPETLSKYILFFLIVGFPITIFFSWVYEMTPEGLKKQSEVDSDASITVGTGQKINYIIMAGMVLAIGGLVYDRGDNGGPGDMETAEAEQARTIAVLPFADMSAAKDQEYFGDGIAEEILNVLVKVDELKVTSRTSAFSLKGKGLSIPEMAKTLNVNYIVEGSIRSAGNNVRVTAQLIKVDSDTHLWSETYDRKLDDIFAIQDEISQAISKALKVKLIGGEVVKKRPTENLEAYQLYLQGRQLILFRGLSNLRRGTQLLEQAVALDPNFSEAWADLATGLVLIPAYELVADRTEDLFRGGVAADKALSLDPNSAQAWAAKGWFYQYNLMWGEARAAFEKAIELNPNNEIGYLWLGYTYYSTGFLADGLVYLEKALEMTPQSGVANGIKARIHLALGEFEKAYSYSKSGISLGWTSSYQVQVGVLLAQGKEQEAVEKLKTWFRMAKGMFGRDGEMPFTDNIEFYVASYFDKSKRDQVKKRVEKDIMDDLDSQAYWGALLSHNGALYAITAKNLSSDSTTFLGDIWQIPYRPLLKEQGIKDYLKEIGLVDYWRNYRWPDLCRPLGEDDFECG